MKKTIIITALAAVALLAGCAGAAAPRSTASPDIVVMKSDIPADKGSKEDGSIVTKIDDLGKIEVDGWLNNETAVICKENKDSVKILDTLYLTSLYTYNTSTKEATDLKVDNENWIFSARLSQDCKFAAYIKSPPNMSGANLYLLEISTQKETMLQAKAKGFAWSGNKLIFTDDNNYYMADTAGNVTTLAAKTADFYLDRGGAAVTGDMLYYCELPISTAMSGGPMDGKLYAFNMKTGEKKQILTGVETFIPAPDQKSALVVLRPDSSGTKLVALDFDGMTQTLITDQKGEGIKIKAGWSPDQNRIAYSVSKTDSSENAVYLYDMLTAESSVIAVDVHSPYVLWSPGGDKLALSDLDGATMEARILYLKAA